MTLVLDYPKQREMIGDIAGSFPGEFQLRGFPGQWFRVNVENSYVTEYGEVRLYLDMRDTRYDWVSFGKGTVDEVKREMVNVR